MGVNLLLLLRDIDRLTGSESVIAGRWIFRHLRNGVFRFLPYFFLQLWLPNFTDINHRRFLFFFVWVNSLWNQHILHSLTFSRHHIFFFIWSVFIFILLVDDLSAVLLSTDSLWLSGSEPGKLASLLVVWLVVLGSLTDDGLLFLSKDGRHVFKTLLLSRQSGNCIGIFGDCVLIDDWAQSLLQNRVEVLLCIFHVIGCYRFGCGNWCDFRLFN